MVLQVPEGKERKVKKEHQLRSHNVGSLFLVFSVPLRASNHCTNCPGYLIQPYVRSPGNLEENLGPCQQHQRCFQWHLPASFTCIVCRKPPLQATNQPIGLGKKNKKQTKQFSFLGGHLESIFCMSLKKKSVKLAANCHGMMIGLCWKRVPEQPDWSSKRHKVTYSKCEAWIKHSSFVCCCVLEWFTPCVICCAHCKCLLYILIL